MTMVERLATKYSNVFDNQKGKALSHYVVIYEFTSFLKQRVIIDKFMM